ncbi:MAG: PAS domain S-box protein [Alphaproteobacteria bacterium]|nr:PAS domain S-box protein [Alphaproteobacteria bacterium]
MPASLTDLFATSLDPMAVLNHDGTIALANRGFQRVLGREPDQLLGVELVSLFHSVDRDRANQAITKGIRTLKPMQIEGRVAHADGGYRWMSWWVRTSPIGTVYASGRDESIRRQIEATVRRRERRNRAMLDHVADILLVVDRELLVRDANATAAAVLGLNRTTLKGLHLAEVAPTLASAGILELREGDGLTTETLLQARSGELVDVEVRMEAFTFDGEGMIVLIARDMRERKAQEQRLRDLNAALQSARDAAQAANDAKTSFVTQMSHALRTPLAAILGYAEMMTEDAPQALSDDLARVHIAATTLLDLVDDVLDLARIEAGAMELSSDYIELEDLASQLVDTVKPLMRGGSLTIEITAEPPALEADRNRLLQMLLNLLTNAIRRSPGASLRLVARDWDEANTAFDVIDDGPPLDDATLARAFEPFGTGGRGSRDGSGLGLAIARQIALGMGGTLDAFHDDGLNRLTAVLPQSSTR